MTIVEFALGLMGILVIGIVFDMIRQHLRIRKLERINRWNRGIDDDDLY